MILEEGHNKEIETTKDFWVDEFGPLVSNSGGLAALRCDSARVGLGAVKVPGPTSWIVRRPRVRKRQLSYQVQKRLATSGNISL